MSRENHNTIYLEKNKHNLVLLFEEHIYFLSTVKGNIIEEKTKEMEFSVVGFIFNLMFEAILETKHIHCFMFVFALVIPVHVTLYHVFDCNSSSVK